MGSNKRHHHALRIVMRSRIFVWEKPQHGILFLPIWPTPPNYEVGDSLIAVSPLAASFYTAKDIMTDMVTPISRAAAILLLTVTSVAAEDANSRTLLWGDTHLHTKYSGDAYALENRSLSPEDAFRFAKGEPVIHPYTKTRVQLETPLDFLVVSDHAEYMGVFQLVESRDPILRESKIGNTLLANAERNDQAASFYAVAKSLNEKNPYHELLTSEIRTPVWEKIIGAAEAANDPGQFTAFIGWEWSSLPNGSNLHRVVFTPDGEDKAKDFLPFSSLVDDRPEGLWNWLAKQNEENGTRFVAIPHNSNISTGLMFDDVMSDGDPINESYAKMRMEWEPVVEMVQVKGASETHPSLSPNDEFAGFEIFEHVMSFNGDTDRGDADAGSYVRSGLTRGLEIEAKTGANPYKFGMIGSTDSHTGLATAEEDNFWGKYGIDGSPLHKTDVQLTPGARGVDMGAQGLAAVWADENSRDAIYEAFKRKEVYATSGPRIALRFFGGWEFKNKHAKKKDLAEIGYENGVPMGGDLTAAPDGEAPRFLVRAVHDPMSAYLDRVQIVKGWIDADGMPHEKIYNIAMSDDREVNENGGVEAVGDTVDRGTASFENSVGAPELSAVWEDPAFNPNERAFYYVRVLEIPTPRHTLMDAVATRTDHPEGYPEVIQERAYSSPIWYTP